MSRDRSIEYIEYLKCKVSPEYFIDRYCQIYDATKGTWLPFAMWPAQRSTLKTLHEKRLVVVLKARQLGLTWLALAFCLWLMLFNPIATILLFSRRDDEATYLLGDERLRGMYNRLPAFLRGGEHKMSNNHEWRLANDSVARAFPTTAGDSYTASMVVIDEADLVPDLNAVLRAVKPTIDAGGRLLLISRADKNRPDSEFKRIYTSAIEGKTEWHGVFLPWYTRPERDEAWYEAQIADVKARTGSLDDVYEQYPATPEQALSPRSLDKRLPTEWLLRNFIEAEPLDTDGLEIYLPGLVIYDFPHEGESYVVGCDPAEGNPTSDDSSATVLRMDGTQVATLTGKFEPLIFASYLDQLAVYYNQAPVLVERNNHGHAVLLAMEEHASVDIVTGWDGKSGWLTTRRGKAMLYSDLAEALRNDAVGVRSMQTFKQLASIDGNTLSAPQGLQDDMAMSFALAYECTLLAGPLTKPFRLNMRW